MSGGLTKGNQRKARERFWQGRPRLAQLPCRGALSTCLGSSILGIIISLFLRRFLFLPSLLSVPAATPARAASASGSRLLPPAAPPFEAPAANPSLPI